MKNKKAFTLIELLAVIVVLAIISLIATPIVTRTIENSKRGAAIESVSNMIEATKLYFVTANPRYGKLNLLDENLNYSGQKPELGEVELNSDGYSRIYAYVNGYCVTKEFGTELYASKMNKEECSWFGTDNYETGEGTTFTLNNQTIKNYLIYGNSTQEVRSGKNLFDYNYLNSTYSNAGLTMTSTDDVITINGTLNNKSNILLSKPIPNKFDTSKTYTLKIHVIGGNGVIGEGTGITFAFALFNSTNTKYVRTNTNATTLDNIGSVTFSGSAFEGEENLYLLLQNWRLETTYNNYQIKIQIEEGSSATAYEKYGAMPSPEFPSEVKSTGDLIASSNCASYGSDACNNVGKYVIQVKSSGKNLFNINTAEKNKGLVWKTGIYYNLDKSVASDFIQIKNNVNYVSKYNMQVILYDANFNYINSLDASNPKKSFVITDKNCKYIKVAFRPSDNSQQDFTYAKDIMLEESNNTTDYESYVEPKITNIYLTEPLRKVGDYADYIDFNNKKVVRNIKEILFNGNERWAMELLSYGGNNFYTMLSDALAGNSYKIYSNRFEYKINGDLRPNYSCIISSSNNLNMRYSEMTSITNFQNFLKENNTTVVYALKTPIEQAIDLPDIKTLDGNSILSINTEVSPSNVKLTTSK